jgi:hypothetical protein
VKIFGKSRSDNVLFFDGKGQRISGKGVRDKGLELVDRLVVADVFWDFGLEEARGPQLGRFALAERANGSVRLVRDRLGLNKLFWHLDPERRVLTAGSFIHDVARETGDYNRIYSVPPAHTVEVDARSLEVTSTRGYDLLGYTRGLPERTGDRFRERVDAVLSEVFDAVVEGAAGRRVFVCLSGGLDSTVIADYAARCIPGAAAVTFSYASSDRNPPGCYHGTGLDGLDMDDPLLSEDFHAARGIAEALGLPFTAILCEKRLDRDTLDDVLRYGQDWRDFNVHCAWVNDRIGALLREAWPDDELLILTGDLMNEYVADYTPVSFGGTEYYGQPRIPKSRLRRAFVFGLESGDREVGIFHRHGIVAVQPYAALAELYLSLPGGAIDRPDAKEDLNLPLIRNEDARRRVSKVKVRAQVGGKEGGTLALFHEAGIDQEALLRRWLELFEPYADGPIRDDLIVTGRYRALEVG